MLKIIIFILVIGVLYALWRMVAKHKINAAFDQQRQDLSQIVQHDQDDDELPEKTKIIKQMIKIVQQDSPWIGVWHPYSYVLNNAWVSNTKPHGISKSVLKYYKIKSL